MRVTQTALETDPAGVSAAGSSIAAVKPPDPPKFELPHTPVSLVLDRIVGGIGTAFSWIWAALVLVIIFQVILRYAFGQGSIMLEEIQWHMYSMGFMIGLSYAIVHDRHVRIDLVQERLKHKTRAVIEMIGILTLMLPFTLFVAYYAWPFVVTSFQNNEVSIAPDGLPYRFAIKSFILIGFTLMILAGISRLTRATAFVFGFPKIVVPSTPMTGGLEDTSGQDDRYA